MMSSVAKLQRERLSVQAAKELKRLIASGEFAAGSKLPSEQELALQLGVTRLTVREALAQLEALGLTHTRHGSGTFVADLNLDRTLGVLSELSRAGRQLTAAEAISLMEFREVVISGFAEQLTQSVQGEQLSELQSVLNHERASVGNARRLAELDYAFNEVLARASGNTFYALLMHSLREVHLQLGEVIFAQLGDDETIIETQAAALAALTKKNAPKLRRVLGSYLRGGTALVTAWAQQACRS